MRYKLAAAVAVVILLTSTVQARNQNSQYLDVRSLGMGGVGITTISDFSALMYNPANLSYTDKLQVDIFSAQFRLDKDIREMISFYSDNEAVFDNYTDTTLAAQQQLLDGLAPFDDSWLGFGAYGHISGRYRNFAIGYYTAVDIEFRTDKGIFEPRVSQYGIADFVTTAGMSFEIPASVKTRFLPNKMHGGAVLKIISRYELQELRLAASDIGMGTAYDTLVNESETGYGIDLGLRYELVPDKVTLGMRVVDLLADIGEDRPPMIVNVGGSMYLQNGLLLSADFNDLFFHNGENLFNKLHLGAEMDLSRIFTVRAGVGQGYPSLGAGLNFGFLAVDGAVYGTERTDRPGGEGDFNYALRLRLGF